MASKFAKSCWEFGVPLNEAWLEFAPDDLKSKYAEMPTLLSAMTRGIEAFLGRFNRNDPTAAFSSLHNIPTTFSEKNRTEAELKEYVLTELFNGDLIATAYREFPSRSQAPVQIAAEKFENDDPDWKTETFEIHGMRYGRIRICDADKIPDAQSGKKQKGSIAAIDLAIDHFNSNNPDFCDVPRKQACQMVRDYLTENHKLGNGLSDQNISKAIVRKCGKKEIKFNSN